MKQIIILIGIILSVLLYGNMASSIVSLSEQSASYNELDIRHKQQVMLVPLALNNTIGLFENEVTAVSHTLPTSEKHNLTKFQALVRFSEHIGLNRYSRYLRYATNLLIRFRKTDIIFPFHYHW